MFDDYSTGTYDRFPARAIAVKPQHFCNRCDCIVEEGEEYCPVCQKAVWEEEVRELDLDAFINRLNDLMEGYEQRFYMEGGHMKLVYLVPDNDYRKAAIKMLQAWGADVNKTPEGIELDMKAVRGTWGGAGFELEHGSVW